MTWRRAVDTPEGDVVIAARPPAAVDGNVDLVGDEALVRRFQAGDGGAFADLYTHYRKRLLRLCQHRLGRGADAEEAVSEAFARAWRALPRLEGDRSFYPWLRVIAANVCTDILRRRARTVPVATLPEGAPTRDAAEIDEALVRQVDGLIAAQALANLSERHRRVLELRASSGWSTQQIAEAEGMAASAVDVLLWRARQALKREYLVLANGALGVAALAGLPLVALRRRLSRVTARMVGRTPAWGGHTGSVLGAQLRGPSGLAVSLLVAGATIAGGTVAFGGPGASGAPAAQAPNGSGSTAQISSASAISGDTRAAPAIGSSTTVAVPSGSVAAPFASAGSRSTSPATTVGGVQTPPASIVTPADIGGAPTTTALAGVLGPAVTGAAGGLVPTVLPVLLTTVAPVVVAATTLLAPLPTVLAPVTAAVAPVTDALGDLLPGTAPAASAPGNGTGAQTGTTPTGLLGTLGHMLGS